MNGRNAKYNADGSIDLEIEHPVYGWIPFTASASDPETYGREIFAEAQAGDYGAVAAYVAPPEPTMEELLEKERAAMVVSRFQARAALHVAGLLPSVQTVMDAPETDALAKLAWEDAQEFRRNSPTIAALSTALGLTANEVDELFRAAAVIEA